MELGALFLFIVVAVGVAAGLHAGPHTSVVSGMAGFAVAGGFLLFLLLGAAGSIGAATASLTVAALLLTLGTVVLGARSLRSTRKGLFPATAAPIWTRTGVALSDLHPTGTVQIGGETWSAEANSEPIARGTEVFVVEVEGLHLKVEADPLGAQQKLEGS